MIRPDFAAIAATALLCLSANAQTWQTPSSGTPTSQMRSVPVAQTQTATQQHQPRKTGWNLNWRRSTSIAHSNQQPGSVDVFADQQTTPPPATPSTVHPPQVSQPRSFDAFAENQTTPPPSNTVGQQPPIGQPIQQVTYMQDAGQPQATANAERDFFANPFGSASQNRAAMPAAPSRIPTEANTTFAAQASGAPQNGLRANQGPGGALSLPPGDIGGPSVPSLQGPDTLPPPAETLPPPRVRDAEVIPTEPGKAIVPDSAESKFRDLLQNKPDKSDPDEPKAGDDSPSDVDEFENPFGRDLDDDDLRRLEQRMKENREKRKAAGDSDADTDEDEDLGLGGSETISCQDFRQRIKQTTIHDVSLDISPPFRPDILSERGFQKLKKEFDAKQAPREWVSSKGEVLTNGRLVDLAYERAVVHGADGTVSRLALDRLSEGDLAYISENWGLPRECLLEDIAYKRRNWNPMTITWKASNLCHKPLYFEDVNLERYGHTHGPILEPVVQSAHFFANIAILPYKMGVHSPHECQYALGYYRPGSCAPWIKEPFPLSAKGALFQGATVTGLFWLVP